MQVSPVYRAISTAWVSQRPARLVASFQWSIRGKDARASVAPWIRAGLVVAVRAPPERNTAILAAVSAGWEACTTNQAGCLNYISSACQTIL